MAPMNRAAALRQRLAARLARIRGGRRRPVRMGATRRPSPFPENRRALLEEVIHPLYDTEGLVTTAAGSTPADLQFFSRPQGQSAASGFNKTTRDTNMLTAGVLARPKVHVVTGIRIVISQITGDTGAAVTLADFDFTDYVSTIRAIMSEALFQFDIGPKRYLSAPVSQCPANVGMSIVGNSLMAPDAAAGVNETMWTWSLFPRGDYYSTLPARLRIPSQQNFTAKLRFTRGLINAVTNVKISVVLDGINGREVQ